MTTPNKKDVKNESQNPSSPVREPSIYSSLLHDLKQSIGAQRDWLANLTTTATVIAKRVPNLIGAGFYVWRDGRLEKGPFTGEATQNSISHGFGILGSVVSLRDPVLVSDLRKLTGQTYTGAVISKLALPLVVDDKLIGILDLDSEQPERFAEEDRDALAGVIDFLVTSTDWPTEAGVDALPARSLRF